MWLAHLRPGAYGLAAPRFLRKSALFLGALLRGAAALAALRVDDSPDGAEPERFACSPHGAAGSARFPRPDDVAGAKGREVARTFVAQHEAAELIEVLECLDADRLVHLHPHEDRLPLAHKLDRLLDRLALRDDHFLAVNRQECDVFAALAWFCGRSRKLIC